MDDSIHNQGTSRREALKKLALGPGAKIDGRSLSLHGKPFVKLSADEQTALLTPLADPQNSNPADQAGVQAFQKIKDFTVFAYYTTPVGMEKKLKYGGDNYQTGFPGACTHPEHQP